MTSVSAFYRSYLSLLATKMNSTNVESERYSDYFNPMPDISNNNFSKKLKHDRNARLNSVLMFSPVICSFALCFVFYWSALYFEVVQSLV